VLPAADNFGERSAVTRPLFRGCHPARCSAEPEAPKRMTAPLSAPAQPALDLTAPPVLAGAAAALNEMPVPPSLAESVQDATAPDRARERNQRIGEIFRKLELNAAIELLKAGSTLALAREVHGVRLLFGFLDVARPGAEVLGQLRGLTSLRRVMQKLASGSWQEPEDTIEVHASQPILAILEEGARLGALGPELMNLPRDRRVLAAVHQRLSSLFDQVAGHLETGSKLPEEVLHFTTQLAMLEVTLLEKRVSALAGAIDPDDSGRISRLQPFLTRLGEDLAHMKDFVARISTYEPFHARTLTVEQAITSGALDKLVAAMGKDPDAQGIARIVAAARERPILGRELAGLVSQLYQVALLRTQHLGVDEPPDLLTILFDVLVYRGEDLSLAIDLEPEVISALWPQIARWGATRSAPRTIVLHYRARIDGAFVQPDGTPVLPEAGAKGGRELSLMDLVRRQIDNDPFILGLLDSPKASAAPGLIAMLARDSRSLRVLERIIRVRRLHTGSANRDVPRLILCNPCHIPLSMLRPFIHVRYVSKVDLKQLGRRGAGVRPDVGREIANYLAKLG
jgi:hypothetical protein